MTLLSVGPKTMSEDEHKIGSAYLNWLTPVYVAAPLLSAAYLDLKWVVAIGFALILPNVHEAGGRLHDLCIRLRRTNIILSQRISTQPTTRAAESS